MKRPKGSRRVERTLKAARRELRATLQELNHQAGKLMTRGDYSAASELADRGKAIRGFEEKVDGLRHEWLTLWKPRAEETGKGATTPLWEYYQLVLEGLEALGGEASRRQLEQQLESRVAARLKTADLKPAGRRGMPRWKVMVRRARKQMMREKYLEDRRGNQWCITSLGRQVAQGALKASEGK